VAVSKDGLQYRFVIPGTSRVSTIAQRSRPASCLQPCRIGNPATLSMVEPET
jgi:hypothetical protein